MQVKKMVTHGYVQIPGYENNNSRDTFVKFEATTNSIGVILDNADGSETVIPWSMIKMLTRDKEAPKK